jgi:Tol biopolymer transport system component
MKKIVALSTFLMFTLLFIGCVPTKPQNEASQPDMLKKVTIIEESGGRVSWSPDGQWIAFDQKDDEGYYDVYIMRPDKTEKRCLTCNKGEFLPQKHNGTPEFHPSGNYIVFTAEKQDHKGNSNYSRPGQGLYNDIWLMTVDGKKFWKIIDLPNDNNYGTVHPHFSEDGNKISWSEMYEKIVNVFNPKKLLGSWKLKSANFSLAANEPKLTDITEHQPNIQAFYENHGYSKDGSKLLFSGSHEARWPLDNSLYTIELSTGNIVKLSGVDYNDRSYDEHAQYTPDGSKIIWGTNRDNANKGMDYWIMNADGKGQKRLTYFNHPTKSDYLPKGTPYTACDFSFDPSGKKMVAWIFTDLANQEGKTVIIELN